MESSAPRKFHSLPLCSSIELRYTVSVTSASKSKYVTGYCHAARFYFYSPALKRSFGKDYQLHYPVTLKSVRKAKGEKPQAAPLSELNLQKGLENLLKRNANIPSTISKILSGKTVQVELNQDELLVFWLTRFDAIAALDTSSRTTEDMNKTMAKLAPQIADFDLSRLLTAKQDELQETCTDLARRIKRALNHREDDVTSNIKDKTKIIRFAIERYLIDHGQDASPALDLLIRLSTPKKGTQAKVADMMRLRSISIERYRKLYDQLTAKNDAESMALLLMIFLGMTAEEVCGLHPDDPRIIPGYTDARQIRIVRSYRKIEKTYVLNDEEDNERNYRNVPLPRAIAKPLAQFYKANKNPSFLLTQNGEPLKPDKLTGNLEKLLKVAPFNLTVRDQHGKQKKVDLSFQPRSYRVSCRFYWKYHCGLTQGEICYLGALTPPDTAAAHYIDYNNPTVQYRMLKQLEYGLALFSNDNTDQRTTREWTELDKETYHFDGNLLTRAHMDLHIKAASTIRVSSNRGILLTKEGSV